MLSAVELCISFAILSTSFKSLYSVNSPLLLSQTYISLKNIFTLSALLYA